MEIKALNKSIVLIKAPDQLTLGRAFVRFQEHYESPFSEIRGKIFTLGYLASLYSERSDRSGGTGGFTYYGNGTFSGDWNGFNLPSSSVEPFVKGLFDPLTKEESDIVEMLRYRTDEYYLIGIHGEQSEIKHEVAHALYKTDKIYFKKVSGYIEAAKKENPSVFKKVEKLLSNWGYAGTVLTDELHAYFGVDYSWMVTEKAKELEKYGVNPGDPVLKKLSVQLNKAFLKHAPDLSGL